jgi:mevalonate kinase
MARIYPSKLLLFGEYTVLSGSQALAVPLSHWKGEWRQDENAVIHEDSPLYAYVDWLKAHDLISAASAAHMITDAEEGWMYEADIPIGYGLGSSGAFVAALYDRYITKENTTTPSSVLEMLAHMEGYFHGSSSGMDPMVSYSGEAVYKNEQGAFQSVHDPGWPEGYKVYLLDSGIERSTGPLVHIFKELLKDPEFKTRIKRELIPVVEHAIHFYLSGTGNMLEECISLISQFEREYFSMLIPDPVKDQWDELIELPGVYVKFCGAGGGGYFQVISTSNHPSGLFKNLISIL